MREYEVWNRDHSMRLVLLRDGKANSGVGWFVGFIENQENARVFAFNI